MKEWFSKIFYLLYLILILPSFSLALNLNTYTPSTATQAGYSSAVSLDTFMANGIKYLLGLVATIFLVLVIVSGFQWLNAGGNEEAVKKAKDRVIAATIGFIIVACAYIITNFVYSAISTYFLYG